MGRVYKCFQNIAGGMASSGWAADECASVAESLALGERSPHQGGYGGAKASRYRGLSSQLAGKYVLR